MRTEYGRQWCVLGGTAGRSSEGEEVAGFGAWAAVEDQGW